MTSRSAILFLSLFATVCLAQPSFIINTVAGDGVQGFAGDGGLALNAEVFSLALLAVDAGGNIYLADTGNCRIRKVTAATRIITTVAGSSTCGYAGDNGPATSAQLYFPHGVAVDSAGNLYIGDSGNNVVRKVNTSGIITTFAGTGTAGYSGDNGPAVNAELANVQGLALDAGGALYIADRENNVIRKVALNGIITTVAGTGAQGFSGNGGPATAATMYFPNAVAFDAAGNLYIAEPSNNAVRMVNTSGIISVIVGQGFGHVGFSGDNGPAINALVNDPQAVAVDTNGYIYISDEDNQRIRMVSPAGIITTICGNGAQSFSGDGGPATSAQIFLPEGIFVGPSGAVYFLDSGNNRIRALTPVGLGQILTFAPLGNVALGAPPVALAASVSSGLPITFTSNSPAVCGISGATATLVGLGTCSITASQTGNSTYAPAVAVTQTFVVYSATAGTVALSFPLNGQTGVSLTPTFRWGAVSGATSYSLYVGTSATPAFAASTTSTTYSPASLVSGDTYFWQVIAMTGAGPAGSAVWSFTTQLQPPPPLIPVPDFNADGDQDVFLYDPAAGNGYAGLSSGAGAFTYIYSAFTPGFDTIRYGNFNSDGFSDLIAYNSASTLGYTLLGNGAGAFSPVSLFWGPGFTRVAAGDLNGDGLTDFVIYRPSDGTSYTAISNGDGTFHYQYGLVSIGFTHMIVADFNGDGKGDVFFYRSTDGLAFLGTGNGSGGFTFSPVTLGPDYLFVETGDINGDGSADLLLYSSTSGAAIVGLSTGSGFNFTTYSFSPGFTIARLFDFNGDGKADLALYNMNNTLGYLGVGSGNGTFTFSSLFWGSGMSALDTLDLNGDGKIDIVIYNTTNGASYTGISTGNPSNPFTYQYGYWGNGKIVATTAAQP